MQRVTPVRTREYRLRKTNDLALVKSLHDLLFGADLWEVPRNTQYWILWCEGKAAGFCSAQFLPREKLVYLTRAGVLREHRGGGLQRRLLMVRENWAKSMGASQVITYTLLTNYPSITNLIKYGFRFYTPEWPWVGDGVHYFYKEIKT